MIALVVLSTFIVGTLVGSLVYFKSRATLRNEIFSNNLGTADLAAQYVSQYIDHAMSRTFELAANPLIIDAAVTASFAKARPDLIHFVQLNNRFTEGVTLLDAQGIARESGVAKPLNIGKSSADRDWFQQAKSTGKPYLGVPITSRTTGKPTAPYGVPILDKQGKFCGVIVSGISLTKLSEVILKAPVGTGTRTSLTDFRQGGTILAHPDPKRILSKVFVSNEAVRRMISGERGALENTNSSGDKVLTAFAPVPKLPWGILITRPYKVAFAALESLKMQAFLLGAFCVLIITLISSWLAGRITRPILALRDAVVGFASGDLTRRSQLSRQDEIGELALVFDEMAETLQAEQTLLRRRAENFFNLSLEMLCVADFAGYFKTLNPSWERILGFTPEELRSRPFIEFVHPEDRKSTIEATLQLATGLEVVAFENRYLCKDGSYRWLMWYSKSSLAEQMIYAVAHDITEHRKAEDETRKMLLMLESVPNGIIVHDADGNFLYANQSAFDMHGYRRDEFMALDLHQITVPESGQLIDDRFKEIMVHGETSFEVEHLKKDGTILPLWINVKKATWDGKSVFLSVESDITERKIAEKALRDEDLRYRTLFDKATDGIFILDLKGRMLDVNESFAQMHGYTVAELLNKGIVDLDTPETAKLIPERMKRIIVGESPLFEVEHYHKDGHTIQLSVAANKMDWKGKPHIISFHRDMTEHKRAEEEKRILEERLQRSAKMESLGQLAGGVAHDLNNVLGILTGYSELLLGDIPEGSRSRDYVEKILQSTEKGAAIIQDLLTLARRGVTVSDVINLNGVVSNFIQAPVFEKMKHDHPLVTFRTECEPNLLNINGSPVHLEKVLMNLVANAAEAIDGAGEVTIRTENRYLDKPFHGYDEVKEGDYTLLIVSDTGAGIPAESIKKVFEPFYTKKTMGKSGTGLGLAIVWGTVKDHKGYIDLQTNAGEGTTFTLYFPVTREEIAAPEIRVSIEQYLGHGESVLIVDDIVEQREIASRLLTRLGYEVSAVASGEEAVTYLTANKADILVLDMIMPGMDGLETYKRVLKVNPKQKAIIVSGFAETDRVSKAKKLGAGAYVKKPYVLEKIGVAIRDELVRK